MIRMMEEKDLDRIAELEDQVFPADPWQKKNFLYEMNDNPYARLFVFEENGTVLGYADLWIMFEQAQIANLAAAREAQGRGIGRALMNRCLAEAEAEGCEVISLEVRVSNERAISLYSKSGFIKAAVRKGYYENGEDAYLMIKPLGGNQYDNAAGN